MSAKLKASIFTTFFGVIGGFVIYKNFDLKILSLVLFYVVLMFNSYFSVKFFSTIIPTKRTDQGVVDLFLVFSYLGLSLSFSNDIWYLLFATLLFVVATIKYIFLLGAVDLKILKKKIIIDIFGGVACILALIGYLSGGEKVIMWLWALVFLLANIYLLIIKPMYRLDKEK
jgi:hypothetical protein